MDDVGRSFTIQRLVDEAGISLQTFYRYFASKDELLLAMLEQVLADYVEQVRAEAEGLPTMEKFRRYVSGPLEALVKGGDTRGRSVTHEHYRLHQLFPTEVDAATHPYKELLETTIRELAEEGQLSPLDPVRDAWMLNEIVRAAFHYYAVVQFDGDADAAIDHVWAFCLRALGG